MLIQWLEGTSMDYFRSNFDQSRCAVFAKTQVSFKVITLSDASMEQSNMLIKMGEEWDEDALRGGKEELFDFIVGYLHDGDTEALAKDATAPPRKCLCPEPLLKLAGLVSPF
nr:probable isoprenylcysteine alpha-carbonyl methylesterase ICMEL2 [Tanacetum cinerariifolium]